MSPPFEDRSSLREITVRPAIRPGTFVCSLSASSPGRTFSQCFAPPSRGRHVKSFYPKRAIPAPLVNSTSYHYMMAKLYWKMASSVDSPLNAPPSKPYGLVPRISIHLSAMKYLVVHGGVSVTPGNNRKVSPLGL